MREGKKKPEVRQKAESAKPKAKEQSEFDTTQSEVNKSEITNMEVHHHPEVEKKGFKEYVLEGLMIFLAVMMGFMAENIREHITEHKNAGILAASLLEDMKKDTASLHSLLAFNNKKVNASDTLLGILHTPRNSWNNRKFYVAMVPLLTSLPFRSTDGTYTQMKTSGTLRYFNQSLVNIINAYGVQLNKTAYRDEVSDKGIWIIANLNFDIINLEAMGDLRFNQLVKHEMYIRINDQQMIDKLINLVAMNKNFGFRTSQEYEVQLKIALKLIEALHKEYHLDDE